MQALVLIETLMAYERTQLVGPPAVGRLVACPPRRVVYQRSSWPSALLVSRGLIWGFVDVSHIAAVA